MRELTRRNLGFTGSDVHTTEEGLDVQRHGDWWSSMYPQSSSKHLFILNLTNRKEALNNLTNGRESYLLGVHAAEEGLGVQRHGDLQCTLYLLKDPKLEILLVTEWVKKNVLLDYIIS